MSHTLRPRAPRATIFFTVALAERAVDWPYSSVHRDIARGIAEPEWSGVVTDGAFGE